MKSKKTMRKLICMLLTLTLCFVFAACGSIGNVGAATDSGIPTDSGGSSGISGTFDVGSDTVEEEATGASEYAPVYTVNVKVVGGDNTILFNGKVTLKSPTMWANEFLRAAITDKGLAQSGIETGFVDTISDYTNNSADGIYWMYTVNGISPMVGSNQYQLRDGDYMLWEYKGFE